MVYLYVDIYQLSLKYVGADVYIASLGSVMQGCHAIFSLGDIKHMSKAFKEKTIF